jgi:O-antigen/teichoic acid export membrane protein
MTEPEGLNDYKGLSFIQKILFFLSKGNHRTKNLKKQFIYSISLKGLGIIFSFLSLPYTLNYLGKEVYGVWAVISSIFIWLGLFDFGLGNGMKNQVVKSLANNDPDEARKLISTAYWAIGLLMILLAIVISIVSPFLNWQNILNTRTISEPQLKIAFLLTCLFMMINFLLSLINSVVAALQKSSYSELASFLINAFWFISIFIMFHTTSGNLILLVIVNGSVYILSYILISIFFFRNHPTLLPRFNDIKKNKVKEMLNLGISFFILQFSYLIIFTTDSLIITQVLGPSSVTEYRVVYQLFGGIALINGLLTANLWTGFGSAYFSGDYKWIKNIMRKYNLLLIGLMLLTFALVLSTKWIIHFWLHRSFDISMLFISLMGVYTIMNAWSSKYAYFLNGIGKIKLQLYIAIIAAVINIPLSLFFARNLNMGNAGVILGSIISISFYAIALPIQTYNILKNKQ